MDEERFIAACLDSREAFDAVKVLLLPQRFSDRAWLVLANALVYYERDPSAQSVDRSLLADAVAKTFPNKKHGDAAADYVNGLPESTSAINTVEAYRTLCANDVAYRLAERLLRCDHSGKDLDNLLAEYEELRHDRSTVPSILDKPRLSWEDIYGEESKTDNSKLPIFPGSLRKALRGGIRRGHNVLIFGRPGAGKTLVTVNAVAGMAHAGYRVLYLANEEPAEEIQRRFLSRLGGKTLWELNDEDREKEKEAYRVAEQSALKRGYEKVVVSSDCTTLAQAEYAIKQVRPDVLVIDQIRHIEPTLDLVQRQETVTRTLRDWAHSYSLVAFGTAQAGPSAENKSSIRLTDLDWSKTGAQGACDLMIGIGFNEALGRQNKRMLSICRNKVSGVLCDIPVWVDTLRTAVKDKP